MVGYEWVKALHVISVIAWMAALLYLPRLFVYHADAETGSVQSETFKVMERRLFRGIMTPAMIATWIFGLWLLIGSGFAQFGTGLWMWVKIVLVIGLSGFHGWMGRHLKNFAADANAKSSGFFRRINEIPTLIMIVVVIMVVVKPF